MQAALNTRYATHYSTPYFESCLGSGSRSPRQIASATHYPTSVTKASSWAIDIAWICVDVNALPCVVVKELISVVVKPPIAATLMAGMPVVLVIASNLAVDNAADLRAGQGADLSGM